MKKLGRTFLLAFVICLIVSVTAPCCFAQNYELTVHAGNRGLIDGRDSMTVTPGYSTRYNLQEIVNKATVTDDKYYIKGVRLAGHDNNDKMENMNVEVNEDNEYVLVYAIKGNMVGYTVRYVSANGVVLAEETHGYANAGDKIVVGSKDVDGYLPNAYNLTKTLSTNESENILTFTYNVAPNQEQQVIILPGNNNNNNNNNVVVNPNQNAANNNAANNQNAAANANNNQNAADNAENANEAAQAPEAEPTPAPTPEPTVAPTPTPVEIIDLDEEEVPLAGGLSDINQEAPDRAKPALVAAGIMAAVLLALVIFLCSRRKRYVVYEDEDD